LTPPIPPVKTLKRNPAIFSYHDLNLGCPTF
jgi:hypothetical protein